MSPQNRPVAAARSEAPRFVWFNGFSNMAHAAKSLRTWHRTWQAAHRRARELRMIAKGLASTDHPILAHIIPMRRCNLSCAYCNEYDDLSKPVPLETMYQRLDRLAGLGTTIITISGGEPLLHPDLDLIIARIRRHGMIAGHDHQRLPAHRRAHRAAEPRRARAPADQHRQRHARRGLEEEPEGARQEAATAGRARRLSREHQFGGGRRHSQSAGRAGRSASAPWSWASPPRWASFTMATASCSRWRDAEREVYTEMRAMEKSSYAQINYFQDNIAHGKENHWRCRAGARYLYICEDGPGALLFAAARLSGQAAGGVHRRRHPPRVPAPKKAARRAARWPACTRFRTSTSGARRNPSRRAPCRRRKPSGWCRFDKRRVRSGVRIADWAGASGTFGVHVPSSSHSDSYALLAAGADRAAGVPKKPVTDTYYGVKVTDDYRWLENFDDPAVKQWTDAQNAAARSFLEALPDRDALSRELRQIFQPAGARYFPIEQRGGKIFAMKSDRQHQHQIVVTLDSLDDLASEHTVLDPDAIDARHLTEIDFAVPSVDGRYLAASLSTGGSESGDVHVYETATGKPLPDMIPRVNYATAGGGAGLEHG